MNLTTAQLKVLALNIYHHFHRQDNPPADEIYVPVERIERDDDEPNVYHATVRFISYWGSKKVHNIYIRFKVDARGRFIANSYKYT